jgi:hypothetical protein
MHRPLVVAAALACLPACLVSPSSPGLVVTQVTGEWSGTFDSSWGALPVKASLRNERGTLSISGEFRVDGQRATGTISGMLETKDRYAGASFWGSVTISYVTASGELCRGESTFGLTGGSGSETAVDIFAEGFPRGNCPDPPTKIHITLRR